MGFLLGLPLKLLALVFGLLRVLIPVLLPVSYTHLEPGAEGSFEEVRGIRR